MALRGNRRGMGRMERIRPWHDGKAGMRRNEHEWPWPMACGGEPSNGAPDKSCPADADSGSASQSALRPDGRGVALGPERPAGASGQHGEWRHHWCRRLQWMCAGTGVRHSEGNPSAREAVHLLQIWVLPPRRDLLPLAASAMGWPPKSCSSIWRRQHPARRGGGDCPWPPAAGPDGLSGTPIRRGRKRPACR